MKGHRKEVNAIVTRLVSEHGCTARKTGDKHWRITRPGHAVITMSATPSDPRALRNIRADIRRYLGIDLKAK